MANETKVVITAQTAQAETAFKSLGGSVDGISKKIFALQGVAATLGVTLSIAAFGSMIKSAIDLGDELNKLSQKTGTSVEALAGLKFAADQNGTSLESVANAAKKLSVSIADTPDIFKKFGITAKDSTGALVQLADIFAAMPDGVEKTALAVKLMGKNGEEMIPFLNQGGDALQKMVEQGKALYPVTAESAKAAEVFNDQLSLLKASSATLGISIANDLIPSLSETTKEMIKLKEEGHGVLALFRGIAGIGKLPWDLLLDEKKVDATTDRINELRANLGTMERALKTGEGGGLINRWLHGSQDELKNNIAVTKKQLELLEKYRDKFNAPVEIKANDPKKTSSTGKDFLAALLPKTSDGKSENTGVQVLIGLEKDYQNELAKRADALNAPLLSASERKLTDDLRNTSKRAQDSRIDLEKLHTSGTLSLENYQARLQDVTRDEIAQRAAIAGLAEQQDKLNASFMYGAQVALRGYLDEVANMANQSETLMKNAFKGMEDALLNFVKTGKLDFSSLTDSIISDLIRIQIRASITGPFAGWLSGFGGPTQSGMIAQQNAGLPNAKGNVFTGPGISAYSSTIVSSPTLFPFAHGTGLMGEAGPEAIMPLKRDASGRLGVRASGGGGLVYSPTFNIDSRTDRGEIQQLMSSAVQQGNAMLVDKLQREGVI